MIELSDLEWKHLRDRGITLCSLCRNENTKNPYKCLAGLDQRYYGFRPRCMGFVSKKKRTPEQERIAAMKADEAQLRLF